MISVISISPNVVLGVGSRPLYVRHLLEPVKLSEIDTSYCMMFPGVFSSKITLDWVWKGPNTTRTLPMVPPGVGGSLQVCRR